MSTYFADIYSALETRLDVMDATPIAWENVPDESTTAEYLRPYHLPGDSVQASLGDSGKDLTNGIFQVSVYTIRGSAGSTLPDTIADHFKRGTILTKNSVSVRIRAVSIGPGQTEDNYYVIPVSIVWQVFTAARS